MKLPMPNTKNLQEYLDSLSEEELKRLFRYTVSYHKGLKWVHRIQSSVLTLVALIMIIPVINSLWALFLSPLLAMFIVYTLDCTQEFFDNRKIQKK